MTLTVTSVNDSSKVVSFKMNLPMYKTNADGSINIDGVDFWKLTEDGSGYTLLITKNYAYAVSSLTSLQRWMTSDVRSYLNSTWISQYPTLDAMSKTVSIYTITDYNSQSDGDIDETQDKVFILSETDAFGTSNSQPVTNTKLYTIGRQLTELKTVWVSQLYSMALRSPRNNSTGVADSTYDLSAPGDYVSGTWGICPLLWVNLSYVPTSS